MCKDDGGVIHVGEVHQMLEWGDVTVEGRSAFMLLGDEGVFKVFLVAPKEVRVKRVARGRNVTVEEAEEAIRVSDSDRKHVIEKLFRKEWLNPNNYDMVINTGLRSYEEAAGLIAKAIPNGYSSAISET